MRLFRSRHSLLGAAVVIVHLSAADLHAEIQIDNISSTTPGTFDVDGKRIRCDSSMQADAGSGERTRLNPERVFGQCLVNPNSINR